jgi:hypothetical protein
MVIGILVAIVILVLVVAATASGSDTPVASCNGACTARYDYNTLVTMALNAGFDCTDAPIAAAIALAESNVPATNPPTANANAIGDQSLAPSNGPAIGIMQINSAKHTCHSQAQLMDAQTNMNVAFQIYNNRGTFSDWTTYNNGAYANFLQA